MKKLSAFLMFFMLSLLVFVPSSFANTIDGYPEFPYYSDNTLNFIQTGSKDGNTSLTCYIDGIPKLESSQIIKTNSDGSYTVQFVFESEVTSYIYVLRDGSWEYVNNQSYATYQKSYVGEIIYSDVNIYNSDGTIFFQPAPPEEVTPKTPMEEMMSQEMPIFLNKVVGTMMTLMVCGVGLIALLVVLNLFGKVSRTFHLK